MSTHVPSGGTPLPVLDHLQFSRILDTILQFSKPPTLLAFRRTCRSLRDSSDALLFRHIVVTGSDKLTILAPHGRLPGLRWDDDDATDVERERWIHRLSHARILDCHTKLDMAEVDPLLVSALSNLETVYRFEPTAPALPARQFVDFASLTPYEGTHAHADASISSPCECASTFTFDIPMGTTTSVTHVLYDPCSVPIHSFLQLGHCPDTTHSIIIYTARTSQTSGQCSPASSCGSDELPRLGMLFHLVEELGLRIGHAITCSGEDAGKHTLVGIDEIDHSLLAVADASYEDIKQMIIDAVREECSIFFPQDVAQQVPNTIAFMSRADYAAQQGWDAFVPESML